MKTQTTSVHLNFRHCFSLVLGTLLLVSNHAHGKAATNQIEVLHNFSASPRGVAVFKRGIDGTPYGITDSDPAIFKIVDGQIQIVGHLPTASYFEDVAQAQDGSYYVMSGNFVYHFTSGGQSKVVANFNPGYGVSISAGVDGNFYGGDVIGGKMGIYKLTPAGKVTHLGYIDDKRSLGFVSFSVLQTANGNLYAAVPGGYQLYPGFDFAKTRLLKISPSGGLTVLHTFEEAEGNLTPNLTTDTNANVYCMTSAGAIMKVAPDNSIATIANTLETFDETSPLLTTGSDGNFYGMLYGTENIFKMTADGELSTAIQPSESTLAPYLLAAGTNGEFYSLSAHYDPHINETMVKIAADGNTSTIPFANFGEAHPLKIFNGVDGNLYGWTGYGGSNGFGKLFQISSNGVYSVIETEGSPPLDGNTDLFQGKDLNFYGRNRNSIFKITSGGIYTNLFQFDGTVNALLMDDDGALFGTEVEWVPAPVGAYRPKGSIFKFQHGQLTILHVIDGEVPEFLIKGADGVFYGTSRATYGFGNATLFRINGYGTTQSLHVFDSEHAIPMTLLKTSDATYGVLTDNTIFKILSDGSIANLPAVPYGQIKQIVADDDGNLYGTLSLTTTKYQATFFRYSPEGHFTPLAFLPTSETSLSINSLAVGVDQHIYATSANGGSQGAGAILSENGASSEALTHYFSGVASLVELFPTTTSRGTPSPTYLYLFGVGQFELRVDGKNHINGYCHFSTLNKTLLLRGNWNNSGNTVISLMGQPISLAVNHGRISGSSTGNKYKISLQGDAFGRVGIPSPTPR